MSAAGGVTLRPPSPDDLGMLQALRGDRALQHQLLAYPDDAEPSLTAVREWIRRRQAEPGGAFFIVVDADGRGVGFVQVAQVHRRGRHGWMGMALSPEARGQGLGGAALDRLLDHARDELALRKLLLEVRADNDAGLALYRRRGFRTVGVLQAHYDDGERFHDVTVMERVLSP